MSAVLVGIPTGWFLPPVKLDNNNNNNKSISGHNVNLTLFFLKIKLIEINLDLHHLLMV